MAASLFFTLVNRALGLTAIEPMARAYFYVNGTTTPLTVYTDDAFLVPYGAYVQADEYGMFPPVYYQGTEPYRLVVTDADGVTLPGYPQDNVPPISLDITSAASIPFSPTEAVPAVNVQAAIEATAALFSDQSSLADRALTPWVTSGTSNAFTVTPDPAITGYGTFLALRVRFDRTNTGASTLNVNGLGTRNIYKMARSGVPSVLAAGDIQPGDVFDLTYDGTQFVISGSIPTVISNSNGRCVRYPDGTQICEHRDTFVFSTSAALTFVWNFPITFAARPVVTAALPASGDDYNISSSIIGAQYASGGSGSSTVGYRIITGQSISSGAAVTNVGLVAHGRWF